MLAEMLDLKGSVELAGILDRDEVPTDEVSFEPEARAVAEVEALWSDGLSEVRAVVARAFATVRPLIEARGRVSKLPSPEDLHDRLTEGRGAALDRAMDALWSPLGEALSRGVERVGREMTYLRERLGAPIAELGPRALRLERLDRVLNQSTAKATAPWVLELVTLGRQGFEAELGVAVAALSDPPTLAEVRAWYGPEGLLPRAILRLERVLGVALDLDRRRIGALVQAATTGR